MKPQGRLLGKIRAAIPGQSEAHAALWLLRLVHTDFAWLKKPLEAPDLPRKRVVADCYAALNPPGVLWTKYLEEIDRLEDAGGVSAEDYDLLRLSLQARGALMDITGGKPAAFTQGTVRAVYARSRLPPQ